MITMIIIMMITMISSLAVAGLLPLLLTAQRECTMFKKEYCNMQVDIIIICIIIIMFVSSSSSVCLTNKLFQLDKILMLDTNMVAADECQVSDTFPIIIIFVFTDSKRGW